MSSDFACSRADMLTPVAVPIGVESGEHRRCLVSGTWRKGPERLCSRRNGAQIGWAIRLR